MRVVTSSVVVAQVWRDGSRRANLARVSTGTDIAMVDRPAARRSGELLARSATADVVDAHLSLLVREADTVATGDDADIRRLLDARGVNVSIVTV
ncbi:MAG: hypothetical protein ACRDNS_25465 [Trebonia sp.]